MGGPYTEPFSSLNFLVSWDGDCFGKLPGAPWTAAELARDAPGLELGAGAFAWPGSRPDGWRGIERHVHARCWLSYTRQVCRGESEFSRPRAGSAATGTRRPRGRRPLSRREHQGKGRLPHHLMWRYAPAGGR